MLKRIHRIGQTDSCIYYLLANEFERDIYQKLFMLQEMSDEVFANQYALKHPRKEKK